jgi:predicted SAM-dependent methyltransferase
MCIKLEIGSGRKPRKGYLTCDIRPLPSVDFICSADQLPFQDETVDEIYSRHLIEHFTLKEFLSVLKEWNRVLKKGAKLYIICPNLLWHLNQIVNGDHLSLYNKESGYNARYWGFGSLFGWQQDGFDVHKFGYYFDLLRDVLDEFGFDQIMDFTNTGKGVENEIWHLEVCAIKKEIAPEPLESRFYDLFKVSH